MALPEHTSIHSPAALAGAAAGTEHDALRQALDGGENRGPLAAGPFDGLGGVIGSVTFTTFVAWGVVTITLEFQDKRRVRFTGSHWGLGVGAATAGVVGVLNVPPEQLQGPGAYTITSTSGAAGVMTIFLHKDDQLVGSIAGTSIGMDLTLVGGSGTWTMD